MESLRKKLRLIFESAIDFGVNLDAPEFLGRPLKNYTRGNEDVAIGEIRSKLNQFKNTVKTAVDKALHGGIKEIKIEDFIKSFELHPYKKDVNVLGTAFSEFATNDPYVQGLMPVRGMTEKSIEHTMIKSLAYMIYIKLADNPAKVKKYNTPHYVFNEYGLDMLDDVFVDTVISSVAKSIMKKAEKPHMDLLNAIKNRRIKDRERYAAKKERNATDQNDQNV